MVISCRFLMVDIPIGVTPKQIKHFDCSSHFPFHSNFDIPLNNQHITDLDCKGHLTKKSIMATNWPYLWVFLLVAYPNYDVVMLTGLLTCNANIVGVWLSPENTGNIAIKMVHYYGPNSHQMAGAVGTPVVGIPIWGGGLFEDFMGVL